MSDFSFAILVDTRADVGLGHIKRSTALQRTCLNLGHEAHLLFPFEDSYPVAAARAITTSANRKKVCIIDCYSDLQQSHLKYFLESGWLIGYLSDFIEQDLSQADFFIGPKSVLDLLPAQNLPRLYSDGCLFISEDSSIFHEGRAQPSLRDANTVVVSIGADDYENIAYKIVDTLLRHTDFTVIYATCSQQSATQLNQAFSGERFTCKLNCDLSFTFSQSHIAVTNSGQTVLQALASGCKTITIPLNSSQLPLSSWLSGCGLATVLTLVAIRETPIHLVDAIRQLSYTPSLSTHALFKYYLNRPSTLITRLIQTLTMRYFEGTVYFSGFSTSLVTQEYEDVATASQPFEQNRWGSFASMSSRHKLLCSIISSLQAKCWLDVGCGTGCAQALLRDHNNHTAIIGIDICASSIASCLNKNLTEAKFFCGSFDSSIAEALYPEVDIVSMVGVASKSPISLYQTLDYMKRFLPLGSYFLFDFPNRSWSALCNGSMRASNHHLWFDPATVRDLIRRTDSFRLVKAWGVKSGLIHEISTVNLLDECIEFHAIYLLYQRT